MEGQECPQNGDELEALFVITCTTEKQQTWSHRKHKGGNTRDNQPASENSTSMPSQHTYEYQGYQFSWGATTQAGGAGHVRKESEDIH